MHLRRPPEKLEIPDQDSCYSMQAKSARNRTKLQNLDGSELNVHDFLNVVRKLKNNLAVNKSEPVQILNFGLVNSELKVL